MWNHFNSMKKSTRCISMPVVAASMAAGLVSSAAVVPSRPNILFIIMDDLSASAVENFGRHPQAYTPNIDRLAGRGVSFINAACNAPLCSPSRPSMLTGLYPHTTGYFGNPSDSPSGTAESWDMPVLKDAKTWIKYFLENGYNVRMGGKVYHNSAERWSDLPTGKKDYGPLPEWGPWPFSGKGLRPDDDYSMNMNLAASHPSMPEIYKMSFAARLSDVPSTPADPKTGFKGYTGWYLYNHPYRYVSEADRDPLADERLAAWAAKFISDYSSSDDSRPFFLNVGINRPHAPLVAPDKYFDLFPLDKIQLFPGMLKDDLLDCAPFLYKNFKTGNVAWTSGFSMYAAMAKPGYLKRWTQAYLACVAYADDMVGRILTALDNSPYRDTTLVVLTSDNGYHMGDKNYLFKNSAWESSMHIPLVVAGPGVASGKVCDAPISLIDLYPTLIEYGGLPAQPHPNVRLDGHSLWPLLKAPEKGIWTGPDVSLSSLTAQNLTGALVYTGITERSLPGRGKPEAQNYSVRSKDFRYIICPDGSEELYDHRNDPYEWSNLAKNPEYESVKKQLRQEAEDIVGRKLGAYYQPGSYMLRDSGCGSVSGSTKDPVRLR